MVWRRLGDKPSCEPIMASFGAMLDLNRALDLNGIVHDDVIKWKHFPRNWPFVREIHRSPVNFPHKGQWRGALMFSLIYVWINDWVNNREAGDLRRQHCHYDVIVMELLWVLLRRLVRKHHRLMLLWNKMTATLETTFSNLLHRFKIVLFFFWLCFQGSIDNMSGLVKIGARRWSYRMATSHALS